MNGKGKERLKNKKKKNTRQKVLILSINTTIQEFQT